MKRAPIVLGGAELVSGILVRMLESWDGPAVSSPGLDDGVLPASWELGPPGFGLLYGVK